MELGTTLAEINDPSVSPGERLRHVVAEAKLAGHGRAISEAAQRFREWPHAANGVALGFSAACSIAN
jgi:hypothetical protein